ncbi:MAG: DNA polymerase-4 [Pseudoalteromonas distincta]|jgi:DNA polymerase-4
MKALCRDCIWTGEAPATRRCPSCGSPRLAAHVELFELSMAHLDCDAFYASVEKRDRPELRDQPVIVGGGVRGVVTTCCYLARVYGVRSAMPMFKAVAACPQAVVIKPDFAKYKAESKTIMGLLAELTPLVQPLSLDEAWMDLSGTERLHGAPPAVTLARAQARIEAQTGLTVSIGLAPNKFLAKIASDLDKPRGFSVIGAAEAQSFLAPRPVGLLPGVGPAMVKSLEAAGLRTIGDLARWDQRDLARRFGAHGLRLHDLAHGRDTRPVDPDQVRKGISAETTFNTDIAAYEALEDRLSPLCERVAIQARAAGVTGRVVTLKLKTPDFRLLTRRRALAEPTQTAKTMFAAARELLRREADGRTFRLIGVGLSELSPATQGAGELFGGEEQRILKEETTADAIRARFGPQALTRGRALRSKPLDRD